MVIYVCFFFTWIHVADMEGGGGVFYSRGRSCCTRHRRDGLGITALK